MEAEVTKSRCLNFILTVSGFILAGIALVAIAALCAVGYHASSNLVIDLSWPNCGVNIKPGNKLAIIGVNGGLDFSSNPCLGIEATQTNEYWLYVNTGDPGFPRIRELGTEPLNCRTRDLVCYSYNYGYQAGLYSLRQANLAGVHSPYWWLDVETLNSWTASTAANQADLFGMVAAIIGNNFPIPRSPVIGIYSATQQWHTIVGNWKINVPLWLGTGDTTRAQAIKDCSDKSFVGSKVLLTQYTLGALDYDYACGPLPHNSFF